MWSTPTAALPQRLTTSPGIDTDPSFSPDGSRIVFESDRSRLAAALRDERRRHRPAADHASAAAGMRRPTGAPTANGSPSPAAAPDGRRIGIIKPDGSGEQLLTSGPGDEGAELGGEQPRDGLPAHRCRGGRTALYRVSLDGGEPRQVDDSAGWLGPRLVGSDGLMRKALLLRRLALLAGSRRGAAAGPAQARRRRPPAPVLLGIDALRADFVARSGGDTVYFGGDSVGLGAPARGDAGRPGAMAAPASRGRGADRRPCRPRRHARSCAGGRRPARGGSARIIWCCWACRRRS